MFIGFPASPNEWVELDSLAFSLRNDAINMSESIAKPVADCQAYFQGNSSVLPSQVRREQRIRVSLGVSWVRCVIVRR